MLCRKPDWAMRLDRFLLDHAHAPFAYGRFDCCLFVADAVLAMTGTDLAEPFRGLYRTRKTAFQAVEIYCGERSVRTLIERAAFEHGMPAIPVALAQRGDLLLLKRPKGYSLALLALNGRDALVMRRIGIWRLPLAEIGSQAYSAWRV